MKLLDPFAGYRLASGHPFLHIALFCVSWFVHDIGDSVDPKNAQIMKAFNLLRWGHFILFALAAIDLILDHPSKIKEEDEKVEEIYDADIMDEKQREEAEKKQKLAFLKTMHRDGSK